MVICFNIVGGNVLTGTIPTEFGLLTALEDIGLGDNKITGRIPTELGSISGLNQITLYNNELTGPIPTEFGLLTSLEGIVLGELILYIETHVHFKTFVVSNKLKLCFDVNSSFSHHNIQTQVAMSSQAQYHPNLVLSSHLQL